MNRQLSTVVLAPTQTNSILAIIPITFQSFCPEFTNDLLTDWSFEVRYVALGMCSLAHFPPSLTARENVDI